MTTYKQECKEPGIMAVASTSPQIKGFITASYEYWSNKSNKNLIQLQCHLQMLMVMNDMKIFEPSNMEALEFYQCLEKFLTPSEAKTPLSLKVINLLTHITASPVVRSSLRDTLKFVPLLSCYLVKADLSQDKALKTLKLLEAISYKIKVNQSEVWVLELVPYLVQQIIDANTDEDLLTSSLSTLANLCRSNPPVLTTIRKIKNRKVFAHKLSEMKTATSNVQLLATEMLFYLKDKATDLDPSFIEDTLNMVLLVASTALAERNSGLLRLTADVFGELLAFPTTDDQLKSYQKYDAFVELLLKNLHCGCPEDVAESLLDVFLSLVELDHPKLQSHYNDIFAVVVPWVVSDQCGTTAVRVIHGLFLVMNCCFSDTHFKLFVSNVKEALTTGECENIKQQWLQRITTTLTLLESLCQTMDLRMKLSKELQPTIFTNLLKTLLCSVFPAPSLTCSDSLTSTYISSCSRFPGSTQQSLAGVKALSLNDPTAHTAEGVAQAVLLILTVVKLFGLQTEDFLQEYNEMVNNPEVMTHLVHCLDNSAPEGITRAASILSEGLPLTSLSAFVKAKEEKNCSQSSNPEPSQTSKLPSFPCQFPVLDLEVEAVTNHISALIAKNEVKDCPLTDIINMYEYRLACSANLQTSLHQSLADADKRIRHTDYVMLKIQLQNDHLRQLLRNWEERLQMVQKEKAEIQAGIAQIQGSALQLRENFRKEKTEMERDKEAMRREISALKETVEQKEESQRRLGRQLTEASEQNKALQKLIKEEEDKQQRSLAQIQKLEEELRKSRRKCDDTTKEKQNLENVQKDLKKENSELEMLVHNQEDALAAKEVELEEVTKKLSELKRIQDMIHNISAGKL